MSENEFWHQRGERSLETKRKKGILKPRKRNLINKERKSESGKWMLKLWNNF